MFPMEAFRYSGFLAAAPKHQSGKFIKNKEKMVKASPRHDTIAARDRWYTSVRAQRSEFGAKGKKNEGVVSFIGSALVSSFLQIMVFLSCIPSTSFPARPPFVR